MKVRILEVDSGQLVSGEIREGDKKEIPSLADGWSFNFSKHSLVKAMTTLNNPKHNINTKPSLNWKAF